MKKTSKEFLDMVKKSPKGSVILFNEAEGIVKNLGKGKKARENAYYALLRSKGKG